MGVAALSADPSTDDTDAALVDADAKVISDLHGLECELTSIMTDTRKDLKDCDIAELQFYLDNLVGVEKFRKCQNVDEVLHKLRREHIDAFNIIYLKQLIHRFHRNRALIQKLEEYEEKKEEFLRATTVKNFQQAVISKADAIIPKGMAKVTITIPSVFKDALCTMKDVEELAIKGFKKRKKTLIKIHVKPGSIIITWLVPEALSEEILQEARENIAVLREKGVEEVNIDGKKSVTLFTKDGREVQIPLSCSSNINGHCIFFSKPTG